MKAPEMYRREVDASLEMLKADVAKLKATAAKMDAEGRSRFDEYVEELDKKRRKISDQLSDLTDAGGKAAPMDRGRALRALRGTYACPSEPDRSALVTRSVPSLDRLR